MFRVILDLEDDDLKKLKQHVDNTDTHTDTDIDADSGVVAAPIDRRSAMLRRCVSFAVLPSVVKTKTRGG